MSVQALHDPRCPGTCGPCGGTGGVEMNRCMYCGGTGMCAGCAQTRACMWAIEGECGPDGCEGCEYGGAGKLPPGSYTIDPDGRLIWPDDGLAPQPLAQLNYDVEYVCAVGRRV